MSRRPIDERSGPATETLTLRLTTDDRALLDRLVGLRAAELADEGLEVTAASYVRGLIRREAKLKGLLQDVMDPRAQTAPTAKARKTEPVAQEDPVLSADHAPRGRKPTLAPDAAHVHAALVRAVEAGATQTDIARRAGITGGQLSRFKTTTSGLSAEALARLASVVRA